MSAKKLKEQFNIFTYDTRKPVLFTLKLLSLLISIIAIGTLIYYYGFPQTEESREMLSNIVRTSFVFYIAQYIIRIIYNRNSLEFIKENKFEGILMPSNL